jgi:hypothetical protein
MMLATYMHHKQQHQAVLNLALTMMSALRDLSASVH